MSAQTDGGPAFPTIGELREIWAGGEKVGFQNDGYNGVTVRDYFAAKAMQAILTARLTQSSELERRYCEDFLAQDAYATADAMLAERQKGAVKG